MEITVVFMLALFLIFSGNSKDTIKHQKNNSSTYYQSTNTYKNTPTNTNTQPKVQQEKPENNSTDYPDSWQQAPNYPSNSTNYQNSNYANYEQTNNNSPTNSQVTYRHLARERVLRIALHYNKYLTNHELEQIYRTTDQICAEKNIDPTLILAIIARESSFNPTAISPSGAKGLGQIMEFNYPSLGIKNPYNIVENIRGTVSYFQQKLLDFQNEPRQIKLALAAYKEGSGAVKRAGNSYSEHTAEYIADILKIRNQI